MEQNTALIETRPPVIALLTDHPKAVLLLRLARKRAMERGCGWQAIFIETPEHQRQAANGSHERILRLLTRAREMGGSGESITASSIEEGVQAVLARDARPPELFIIGGMEAGKGFARFKMLPWLKVVQSAGQHTQVEILPLSGPAYKQSWWSLFEIGNIKPFYFLYAMFSVIAAATAAVWLQSSLPPALFRINEHNIGLLFMTACAFAAGRYGLLPGLAASIASFLIVNYYFTVPYGIFKFNTVTDLLSMTIFLSAAILISFFTSRTRSYAENATKRERSTQVLFTLYRVASESYSRQQAIEKLQRMLEEMLEVDVAFFLPPLLAPDRVELAAPAELSLNYSDQKALEVCWREMKVTGVGSPFNPGSNWRFEPMVASGGEIGVIAVRPRMHTHMDAWFGRLLAALSDQTANVLEHIELERSMEATRISEEREKLRSMLLSSVSHDLKTPLAGIIGALSVYISIGNRLTPEKRSELLECSLEEAQRLDSFLTNILDMTRLESGNIKFKPEWTNAQAMVDDVCKRLKHRLKKRRLLVHPAPVGLEVYADVTMTQQVLQNIIDNACKYTPENTAIEITLDAEEGKGFTCIVRDHGPGLPADKMSQAFDKYARLHKQDSQVAGTGLGLAIAKAVIEAQGGTIIAGNHPDGGAMFTFRLPGARQGEAPDHREERLCHS